MDINDDLKSKILNNITYSNSKIMKYLGIPNKICTDLYA